jgi:hypothetical protein
MGSGSILLQEHNKEGGDKEALMSFYAFARVNSRCGNNSTELPADWLEPDTFWFRAFIPQTLALVGFIFLIVAVKKYYL